MDNVLALCMARRDSKALAIIQIYRAVTLDLGIADSCDSRRPTRRSSDAGTKARVQPTGTNSGREQSEAYGFLPAESVLLAQSGL